MPKQRKVNFDSDNDSMSQQDVDSSMESESEPTENSQDKDDSNHSRSNSSGKSKTPTKSRELSIKEQFPQKRSSQHEYLASLSVSEIKFENAKSESQKIPLQIINKSDCSKEDSDFKSSKEPYAKPENDHEAQAGRKFSKVNESLSEVTDQKKPKSQEPVQKQQFQEKVEEIKKVEEPLKNTAGPEINKKNQETGLDPKGEIQKKVEEQPKKEVNPAILVYLQDPLQQSDVFERIEDHIEFIEDNFFVFKDSKQLSKFCKDLKREDDKFDEYLTEWGDAKLKFLYLNNKDTWNKDIQKDFIKRCNRLFEKKRSTSFNDFFHHYSAIFKKNPLDLKQRFFFSEFEKQLKAGQNLSILLLFMPFVQIDDDIANSNDCLKNQYELISKKNVVYQLLKDYLNLKGDLVIEQILVQKIKWLAHKFDIQKKSTTTNKGKPVSFLSFQDQIVNLCQDDEKNVSLERKQGVFELVIKNFKELYFNEGHFRQLSLSLLKMGKLSEQQIEFLRKNRQNNLLVHYSLFQDLTILEDILDHICTSNNFFQKLEELLNELKNQGSEAIFLKKLENLQYRKRFKCIFKNLKEELKTKEDNFYNDLKQNYPLLRNFMQENVCYDAIEEGLVQMKNLEKLFGFKFLAKKASDKLQFMLKLSNPDTQEQETLSILLSYLPKETFRMQKEFCKKAFELCNRDRKLFLQNFNPALYEKNKQRFIEKQKIDFNPEETRKKIKILVSFKDELKNRLNESKQNKQQVKDQLQNEFEEINSSPKLIFECLDFMFHDSEPFLLSIKNKDVVLVIGATGSGKSTTSNSLEFFAREKKVPYSKDLKPKRQLKEKFARSSGTDSKTYTPSAVELEQEGYVLVDNPGLGENRGFVMNLFQSLMFIRILQMAKSIRFLVIYSSYAIDDSRAKSIKDFFVFVNTFIPKHKLIDYSQSFQMVFTNFDDFQSFQTLKTKKVTEEKESSEFYKIMQEKLLPIHYYNKMDIEENSNLKGFQSTDQVFAQLLKNIRSLRKVENLGEVNVFLDDDSTEKMIKLFKDQEKQISSLIDDLKLVEALKLFEKIRKFKKIENENVQTQLKVIANKMNQKSQQQIYNYLLNLLTRKKDQEYPEEDLKYKKLITYLKKAQQFEELKSGQLQHLEKIKMNFLSEISQKRMNDNLIDELRQQLETQRSELLDQQKKERDQKDLFNQELLLLSDKSTVQELIQASNKKILQLKIEKQRITVENEQRGKISHVNFAWQIGKIEMMLFLQEQKFDFHESEKTKECLVSLLRENNLSGSKIKTKIFFLTKDLKKDQLISAPDEVIEEGAQVKRYAVFEAVRSQDFKLLQYLKANKFDLNVKENGVTLLSYAIYLQNIQIIDYLLENSFDPLHVDNNGFNDLMSSICTKNVEIIKKIIKKILFSQTITEEQRKGIFNQINKNQNNLLHLGSSIVDKEILQTLIEHTDCNRLNKNNQSPAMLFLMSQNLDLVSDLLEKTSIEILDQLDVNGNSIMDYIAEFTDPSQLRKVLKRSKMKQVMKANPDWAPALLGKAIFTLNQELINFIQKRVSKIDEKKVFEVECKGVKLAKEAFKNADLFRLLLLTCNRFMTRSDFFTDLMNAENKKNLQKIFHQFIKSNKDSKLIKKIINQKKDGVTLISQAIRNNDPYFVQILVQLGVDLDQKNDDETTARENPLIKKVLEKLK